MKKRSAAFIHVFSSTFTGENKKFSFHFHFKLNDIFHLQVVSFVYEWINNPAPVHFRNYFTTIHSMHDIGTRQSRSEDLYVLRCNTTEFWSRYIHQGVQLWN